jgi:hypothetical protein
MTPGLSAMAGPQNYNPQGRPRRSDPPSTVAILASQSGFSQAATLRAWRSPSPMLLLHLPGGRPPDSSDGVSTDGEQDDGVGAGRLDRIEVTGAFMNPALQSREGLLGQILELRKEELDKGGTRYRVWYKGKPMERQGPLGPRGV